MIGTILKKILNLSYLIIGGGKTKIMSLIKPNGKLFEHSHRFEGYASGQPYLYNRTNNPYVDGINRGHIGLYGKCDICGEEILVANMHVDPEGKLYKGKFDK